MRCITHEELSQHKTAASCWLLIEGQVYDVTSFLSKHPGGSGLLVELGGLDATEDFLGMHPRDYLKQYLGESIGQLGEKENEKEKEEEEEEESAPELIAAELEIETAQENEACEEEEEEEDKSEHHPPSTTSNMVLLTQVRGTLAYRNLAPLATSLLTPYEAFYSRKKHWAAKRRPTSSAFTFNLTLKGKDILTHNTLRLVFQSDKELRLDPGQHVYLCGADVMRPYTPVEVAEHGQRVVLVIKVYDQGSLTQYLSKLNVNSIVEGEVKDFDKFRYFNNGVYDAKGEEKWCANMAMVAGGTGITPMYSIIKKVLSDPFDTTRIWLLYANQTPYDILLKSELDSLAKMHPHRFHIWYTIDSKPSTPWAFSTGYINTRHLSFLPSTQATVTLLCGPPPMSASVAKLLNTHGQVIVL